MDGGHGALRGREEQGLAERELGHPDSLSTSKEPLQGFKEEIGGGKSKGQGFRVIVTVGRQVFVSLHIGGPEPGEIILINVPATQRSYYFGTRGDKKSWLSHLSPGGSFVVFGLGNSNLWR